MWNHLEPHSAKLEEVFEPLYEKATAYERLWSIAELRLAEQDIHWLRSWFNYLTPKNTENWIKSVMLTSFPGKAYATYRQMFGSLLICVGAEVCREASREDSVWPTIRGLLPDSHALRRELFLSNGQPSCLTKDLITDAVRSLNLRHAMDLEGTQQWFITIKLQYGFTYRGAKNRLAEWLVNLGSPHAVQYLNSRSVNSELASESFQSLWRALTQYRRDLISEAEIRSTLHSNPWIRAHWIDDLLMEAKARIEVLGVGDWQDADAESVEKGVAQEVFCPISGLALVWPSGKTPRLMIDLDRDAIGEETHETDAQELDIHVDRSKITRWLRQEDGNWSGEGAIYAEPDSKKRQPNLNPRILAVRSPSGETLVEWDFTDSGFSEQVLVFDLDKSRIAKSGEERLEPNRHYAIVCDRKCEIHGCIPVETFDRTGLPKKAIRLPVPLNENICMTYDEFVLWQPVRSPELQGPRPLIVLATPLEKVLSLNDRTRLILDGLPSDAKSVQLLIHTKTYEVRRQNGIWETLEDVTMTPELAGRQRRVRVRFVSDAKRQTHEPQLSFCLLSAAILRSNQDQNTTTFTLEALRAGTELNRSEGTAYLRVWTPEPENAATICEGDCQIGRARHGRVRLRDIPGHGGELKILSGDEIHSLDVCCLDKGCVSAFRPGLLSSPAVLALSDPKEPGEVGEDGYLLWQWTTETNTKARLHCLPIDAVLRGSNEHTWKVQLSGQPMAIGLAWKGCWLGASWDVDQILHYIEMRTDLSESEFAILKWLRVPVLKPRFSLALAKKIQRAPCQFIRSWLKDSAIPQGLRPHDNIGGIDFVVRHFLWSSFPPSQAREAMGILTGWDGNLSHSDRYIGHLGQLADVSPVLMWKGLECFLKHDARNTLELIRAFTCARLGLTSNANKAWIRSRLEFLEKRAAQVTGINGDRLSDIANGWIKSMHQNVWQPGDSERLELARIGETQSGRHYISTSMCRYWLMLSGEKEI